MLCTQYDWRLDNNNPVLGASNEPFTEAMNNTRSRALRSLVKFGYWLRRNDSKADISFVRTVLEERFAADAEFLLKLPEYAMLGVYYGGILGLDTTWAVRHESDLFPQQALDGWRAAFGSLLQFTYPHSLIFETLRRQFWFAIENVPFPEEDDNSGRSVTDVLGQHLFIYYLWGLYPLRGEDSLLERFFQKTSSQPERWGTLFSHVGFILRKVEDLGQEAKDRVVSFFDWRLEQGKPEELKEFWVWLDSECLDAEWRLDALSKTLDIGQPEGSSVYRGVRTLSELVPDHVAKVVECFTKLTDKMGVDSLEIQTESAKRILKIGLESTEEGVRQNALLAHENLLKRGRADLLDLDD